MPKLHKILTTTLLLISSATCICADAASGTSKIANIIVTEGNAFVYTATPLTDWAECATYGSSVNRLAINTSTAQGRAVLNTAQLALVTNKTVSLVGRKSAGTFAAADQCSVQSGDETLFFIVIGNS